MKYYYSLSAALFLTTAGGALAAATTSYFQLSTPIKIDVTMTLPNPTTSATTHVGTVVKSSTTSTVTVVKIKNEEIIAGLAALKEIPSTEYSLQIITYPTAGQQPTDNELPIYAVAKSGTATPYYLGSYEVWGVTKAVVETTTTGTNAAVFSTSGSTTGGVEFYLDGFFGNGDWLEGGGVESWTSKTFPATDYPSKPYPVFVSTVSAPVFSTGRNIVYSGTTYGGFSAFVGTVTTGPATAKLVTIEAPAPQD